MMSIFSARRMLRIELNGTTTSMNVQRLHEKLWSKTLRQKENYRHTALSCLICWAQDALAWKTLWMAYIPNILFRYFET